MARGVVTIDLEQFKKLLRLPDDYKAVSAYYAHLPELVCLVVEHDSIPESITGKLTGVKPLYQTNYLEIGDEHISLVTLADVHFTQ